MGIECSRLLELYARRFFEYVLDGVVEKVCWFLVEFFEGRLCFFFLIYFGMVVLVMNCMRFVMVVDIVEIFVGRVVVLFGGFFVGRMNDVCGRLMFFDFLRGVDSDFVRYEIWVLRGLLCILVCMGMVYEFLFCLYDELGCVVFMVLVWGECGDEFCFVVDMEVGGKREYRLESVMDKFEMFCLEYFVIVEGGIFKNEYILFGFDLVGMFMGMFYKDEFVLGVDEM